MIHLARTTVLAVCIVATALPALAQIPLGSEFRVDSAGSVDQYTRGSRNMAMAPDGRFVVTWSTTNHVPYPNDDLEVRARRFDPAGAAQGPTFAVNTYTTRIQYDPSVAIDATGSFVMVWNSNSNGFQGTVGQRFDASGARLGGEFVVRDSAVGSGGTFVPTVAVAPGGGFLAVWQENVAGPLDHNVIAQRFDAAGNAVGSVFQVNDATNTRANRPVVDVDAAGNFVVVWYANFQPDFDVLGRRLSATGTPLGAEFRLSSNPGGGNAAPVVASAPDGSFAVAWQVGANGIRARRFDAAGSAITPDLAVSAFGGRPAIDTDAAGDFVVAWSTSNGSDFDVFSTRFSSTGLSLGPNLRVNTYTTGDQSFARVASDAAGNFVVGWLSAQDGVEGAFAQRYAGGPSAAALAVDYEDGPFSDGNGVFEVNEEVKVAPSWLNGGSGALTFTGALFSFGGPGPSGPYFPPGDSVASYGTVASGATQSCAATGDCYAVGIFTTSGRPVAHWDATMEERLVPLTLAANKTWTLHLGDSFADVPRANPFYRFVETVFHRGVTNGCGASVYCPASSTTRAQMAVFALVAKDGPGNVPRACGTPMFADVPASSPFCPWIEELARRGVVGGCGVGIYCPAAAVSREQMAIIVLRTKEPALTPPGCIGGIRPFNDVPASSPFCPWIEELARRNVVGGCGGGNYCPTSPVTREQMTVFISATFGLTLYGP